MLSLFFYRSVMRLTCCIIEKEKSLISPYRMIDSTMAESAMVKVVCHTRVARGPKFVTAARNFNATQPAARPGPQKARINIIGPKISVFNSLLESQIRNPFMELSFCKLMQVCYNKFPFN